MGKPMSVQPEIRVYQWDITGKRPETKIQELENKCIKSSRTKFISTNALEKYEDFHVIIIHAHC
jgi:hypothetical protein